MVGLQISSKRSRERKLIGLASQLRNGQRWLSESCRVHPSARPSFPESCPKSPQNQHRPNHLMRLSSPFHHRPISLGKREREKKTAPPPAASDRPAPPSDESPKLQLPGADPTVPSAPPFRRLPTPDANKPASPRDSTKSAATDLVPNADAKAVPGLPTSMVPPPSQKDGVGQGAPQSVNPAPQSVNPVEHAPKPTVEAPRKGQVLPSGITPRAEPPAKDNSTSAYEQPKANPAENVPPAKTAESTSAGPPPSGTDGKQPIGRKPIYPTTKNKLKLDFMDDSAKPKSHRPVQTLRNLNKSLPLASCISALQAHD